MAANPASILDSVKKTIGLEPEYDVFDLDITLQINMAFGLLRQMGVGSDTGFIIQDNTTLWSQYITNLALLGMVKSYIYMVVKLAFDPPATSFGIKATQDLISELAWRINVAAEEENPPSDPFADDSESQEAGVVLIGGVMQGYFAPRTVQIDYASVVTPDAKSGNVFYLTLTGPCQINAPVNGVDGQHITLELASGGFSVTWGTGWNFGAGGTPELSSAKTDIISAVCKEPAAEWWAGFTSGF